MARLRRLPLTLAFSSLTGAAFAAGLTIGVVAPTDGSFASLGQQILDGATFRAVAAGNTVVAVHENCEAGNGADIAKALIEAKVTAAIGFLCSETLEGALPLLKEAQIPAVTVSVRSAILMEDALKSGWPLFRMAPSDGMEAARLTEVLLADWQGHPFALIEDGTIHGRELTETIRNRLEEKGLKPVFTDTYRPGQEQQIALVRRLAKAGATHVFIGGDRSDAAIIARDAAAERITLGIMGADALNAANQPVPLRDGVRAVTLPDYAALPANAALVIAMHDKGLEPEGYVLRGYAAAAVVAEAADNAKAENRSTIDSLSRRAFETSIGPVRFNENHELTENPYRLLEWRGGVFAAPLPATN